MGFRGFELKEGVNFPEASKPGEFQVIKSRSVAADCPNDDRSAGFLHACWV